MRVKGRARMRSRPSRSPRCVFLRPRTRSPGIRRGILLWAQERSQVVGLTGNVAMWSGRDKSRLRQRSRQRRGMRSQNNPSKENETTGEVPVEMYSDNYKSSYLMKYPIYPKRLASPVSTSEIAPNQQVNTYSPSIHVSSNPLGHQGYLSVFRPHLANLLGAFISIASALLFAFSRSSVVILGVGGTSSIFDMPLEFLLGFRTFFGNSDRRGVKAVATRLADFRILARTSQDLFLAR